MEEDVESLFATGPATDPGSREERRPKGRSARCSPASPQGPIANGPCGEGKGRKLLPGPSEGSSGGDLEHREGLKARDQIHDACRP